MFITSPPKNKLQDRTSEERGVIVKDELHIENVFAAEDG